jgi:hypothetical protein
MADATPTAPVIFKKRAGRANLKKRAATPPSASDSDYSSAEDESGARIKRRRKGGITTSTSAITKPARTDLSKSTQFAGDRSAAITNLDDATKTSNWFHADEAAKGPEAQGEVEKDGTYKGAKGYGNFIQKNPDKLGKSVGPVKAPTNMRMITLVDFAPDVCKDYKQTGFVSCPPLPYTHNPWRIVWLTASNSAVSAIAANSSTQEKTTNKAGNSTKNGKRPQNQKLQEHQNPPPPTTQTQTHQTLKTTTKQKNSRKSLSRVLSARNRTRAPWSRNAVITFARFVL